MPLLSSVLRALPQCFQSPAPLKPTEKTPKESKAGPPSQEVVLSHAAVQLPAGDKPTVAALAGRESPEGRKEKAPPPPTLPQEPRASPSYGPKTLRVVQVPPLHAGLAIIDGFLDDDQLQAMRAAAMESLCENSFQAGMGGANHQSKWSDNKARGDNMRWLYREEELRAGRTAMVALMDQMAVLRQQLLDQGYDVGGRITFQLACYPGNGSRYVRHRDASDSCPTRCITAICYLNPGWHPMADGGALAVYNVTQPNKNTKASVSARLLGQSPLANGSPAPTTPVGHSNGEPATVLAPVGGRVVVFQSRTEHEVLPSQGVRYAVTVWLHRKSTATHRATVSPFAAASPQGQSSPFSSPGATGHQSSLTSMSEASLDRHQSEPSGIQDNQVIRAIAESTAPMQGAGSLSRLDRGRMEQLLDDAAMAVAGTASQSRSKHDARSPGRVAAAAKLGLTVAPSTLAAGFAVFDGFLDDVQLKATRPAIVDCLTEASERLSGESNQYVRSSRTGLADVMRWLKYDEEVRAERHALVEIMERMTELKLQLLESGYDVSGHVSYRLACYPGNGYRSVRHADVSEAHPDRVVTALCYLNGDWRPQVDGGQLALYNVGHQELRDVSTPEMAANLKGFVNGEPAAVVAPVGGRLVLMLSDVEHEVLASHRSRYALSVWFHKASSNVSSSDTNLSSSQCQRVPEVALASVLQSNNATVDAPSGPRYSSAPMSSHHPGCPPPPIGSTGWTARSSPLRTIPSKSSLSNC